MNWLARALLAFALLVVSAPLAAPVAAMEASMPMPDCDQCSAQEVAGGRCLTGCFTGLIAIMPPAARLSTPLRARIEAVPLVNPAGHARLPDPRPPNAVADLLPVA